MYKIVFDKKPLKVIKKWKKSNPQLYAKLRCIIAELEEHPRTDTGHPEPLSGGGDMTYSRHITAKDRIIYDIYDEVVTVLVLQVEDHYNDK